MAETGKISVLLIGSGGREHALAWKIKQSPLVDKLFIAPGNAGTAQEGFNVPIKEIAINGLVDFAVNNKIDLVVVGPEAPLVDGIADLLNEKGILCFGPSRYCAQLEGSKSFAKKIMAEAGVPTAAYNKFTDYYFALDYIRSRKNNLPVIKADGLAAGKGVTVPQDLEEAESALKEVMLDKNFGSAGEIVVIEDRLEGEEASLIVISNGTEIVVFPSSQDHKQVYDRDKGPNTGGMGAYSPAPVLADAEAAAKVICQPVIDYLNNKGTPFVGVLYAGLMVKDGQLKVLEFNVRFGDPECQPLLMRLKTDIVELMLWAVGKIKNQPKLEFEKGSAICVVMASEGYPGKYPKGMVITGIEEAEKIEGVKVVLAGVKEEDGDLKTSGGRVLGVTAINQGDFSDTLKKVYQAVGKVRFEGAYFRKDIGQKALK